MTSLGVISSLFLMALYCSAAHDKCNFNSTEGRVYACGTDIRQCIKIIRIEDHGAVLINNNIQDFNDAYYDVHAYRLCSSELASEVTLDDAIRHGQVCQRKRNSNYFRTVLFEGCADYFTEGSNKDLTIYAYSNQTGCNGELFYRFLFINGTSMVTVTSLVPRLSSPTQKI